MYQYIFFDVDGTLTDPSEGITKTVQYTLSCMGIDEPDLTKLHRFIGPPLKYSLAEFYGFSPEQAEEGVRIYLEEFAKTGVNQNRLWEGVPELLIHLKEQGRVLATASSKMEPFLIKTLEMFHITQYFDYICGGTLDGKRHTKEEVIAELLRRMDLTGEERKKILMVGDRKYDVEGAAGFGIPCVGFSPGFAEEGELEKAGAIAVVDSMKELEAFILKG